MENYIITDRKAIKILRAAKISVSYEKYTNINFKDEKQKEVALSLIKKQYIKLNASPAEKKTKQSFCIAEIKKLNTLSTQHKEKVKSILIARQDFAINYAERYHIAVKSLYTSQRAYVIALQSEYNASQVEDIDRNAYSKSYGFPATWKNAAVVIRGREFSIYTSRGTKVTTVQIPAYTEIQKFCFDSKILLPNDMYAIRAHEGVYTRFDKKGKRTGLAVQQTNPEGEYYYEHGVDMAEIKREVSHKKEIAKLRELEAKNHALVNRAASLIKMIAKDSVKATYSDARAAGYCNNGIQSFCIRHGMNPKDTYSISDLISADIYQTKSLVDLVAKKAAVKIVSRIS